MAVGFDVASESHTGTTGNTSSASFTWNHAGGASARGALVFVYSALSSSHYVTSVTYGGTTMTEVPYSANTASGENGAIKAFYLDNCGTGTKAVVVNRTNNATIMYAQCFTVTGASATEVYNAGVVTQGGNAVATGATVTSANNLVSPGLQAVDDGSPGTNSLRFSGLFFGGSSPIPGGTGSTSGPGIDFGVYTINSVRETTAGQGSRNVGYATATGDDICAIYLAVRETPAANVLVQPGPAAITVDTATATVVAQNWPLVQPAAAAVAFAGATPAITLPVSVQPAAAALALAGATPVVAVHVLVQPSAASVAFSGATPAVVAQNYVLVQPAAATVAIATATPAVSVSASVSIQPAAAAISIAGATPVITAQDYRLIQPTPASVAITAFAPDIVVTDHKFIRPDPAVLTITTFAPLVVAIAGITVQPGPASLVITGVTPRVHTTDWSKMTMVMEGIATTLRAKGYRSVWAYPVPSLAVPSTVVGYPTSIDYDLVYQRGADRFVIVVRLVVGTGTSAAVWKALGKALLGPESLAGALDGEYPWGIARVQQARVEGLTDGGLTYATARAEVEVIA